MLLLVSVLVCVIIGKGDYMKKITEKYRDGLVYDLSCSEAIMYAANEKYNLNLSSNEFKMMAPFSGGMFEGDTCGIVTASISILGILLTDKVAHNSPLLREAVLDLKSRFGEKYSSLNCKKLVETQRDEVVGCDNLIINASQILEDVVKKYVKI